MEIQALKKDLKDIEFSTEKISELLADVKINTSTMHDGVFVATQTAAALKNEFGALLDKVNMKLGKLNVIEQRTKDIKLDVTATQTTNKHT